jgi:Family of unknown function (DUF6286)
VRVLNRPLGFLLAVALAIAAVITIVEVIAVAVHAKSVLVPWRDWYHWAQRTHWNRPVIKIWSIILASVGLILLMFELKRTKPKRIRLQSNSDATDAAITRNGITGAVQASVLDVDGIRRAGVTATRRSITVDATSAAKDRAGADTLTDPVTDAVSARLTTLKLKRDPRVRVRVRPRSN